MCIDGYSLKVIYNRIIARIDCKLYEEDTLVQRPFGRTEIKKKCTKVKRTI